MVFCNDREWELRIRYEEVTILILIDGFLQYNVKLAYVDKECHNPYFNRWFSAILKTDEYINNNVESQSLF